MEASSAGKRGYGGKGRWVKYWARLVCWISRLYGPFSLGSRFETYKPFVSLIFQFFSGRGKLRVLYQRILGHAYNFISLSALKWCYICIYVLKNAIQWRIHKTKVTYVHLFIKAGPAHRYFHIRCSFRPTSICVYVCMSEWFTSQLPCQQVTADPALHFYDTFRSKWGIRRGRRNSCKSNVFYTTALQDVSILIDLI
jgi:hypothetical protein